MGFPSLPARPFRMLIERFADTTVVWAPAKVNLFLEILGKRADGYHEIATLMVAIRLFDTLILVDDPAGDCRLACDRPDLSTGPDNLILRAAALLREHTGCRRGAAIRLVKRIPLAAGLAGGSTDAAGTLAGLNALWGLGLAPNELAELAGRLGSDVPFFLGGPAAWCTGRGEIIRRLDVGAPLYLVLLCPQQGLSTADVYKGVTVPSEPKKGDPICQALVAGQVEEMGRLVFNRLQESAQQLCPELAGHLDRLRELNPAGTLMSGSGSTLFALCRDFRQALTVARHLRAQEGAAEHPRIFLVRSCT